jgi:hypothetical protein
MSGLAFRAPKSMTPLPEAEIKNTASNEKTGFWQTKIRRQLQDVRALVEHRYKK